MRWNFGGNLQPVRMICEYDWKECPTALVSYIWSEIVTDVIDSVTGESYLWRILAVMLLCLMLFHTIYYKTRWMNKREHDFAKVGYKMQDLELKINILTYKMQYGNWPLPHEISTPSLNELRNVKLTLSNTSRQDMWTKHHLHGYISKCFQNSENDKSMTKLLSTNKDMELAYQNFVSQLGNRNDRFETLKPQKNLKLLHRGNNCKDYERLLRTAEECRKYMDEINESNKSLGLLNNSSDISDQNSVKDISAGTDSEKNGHHFLIDPKKWQDIYDHKNEEIEDASESDLTELNQIFSVSNEKYKELPVSANDERYPLNNSNRSRLLPPGLSITFLSDKFKAFASSDKCVAEETSRHKTSTNETLNKVKEKLESLHDIKQVMKNSKSLSNVYGSLEKKKSSEISLLMEKTGKINPLNRNNKKCDKKEVCNIKKFDKLISNQCNSNSGDNEATLDLIPAQVFTQKIPLIHSNNQNFESVFKTMNNSFSNIGEAQNLLDSNSHPEIVPNTNLNSVYNPWKVSGETTKNLNVLPNKTSSSLSKISQREEDWSTGSDSSISLGINTNPVHKNGLNPHRQLGSNVNDQNLSDCEENLVKCLGNFGNNEQRIENDINLNLTNETESISYVLWPHNKLITETSMETGEYANLISQTSSKTELSKDSDTDDKSTTTLLREALEFKKALLIQIQRENEICEEKSAMNESSECESDDTSRSKTDNHFRSKLLDIISEEQSAGSSTEKTSRTYILSRAINETNLCEDQDKYSSINNNTENSKSNKITAEGECYGDLKIVVAASSSEYFSTNNVTDNEHTSAQRINQCVADGDGLRELEKSYHREVLQLNVTKNHENNNITQGFDVELKKYDAKEEIAFLDKESKTLSEKKPQDIVKRQTTIEACVQEKCENPLEKIEEQIDSVEERIGNNSEAKIKLFRSLSSIDSEKGISWNSISESSSDESIAQFVNALSKLESKSIDSITEEKLMMLNSTDYEGRNFATAGEDSRYRFNSHNKRQPGDVLFSEINASEQSNGIIEEILGRIADSAIFKLQKLEMKEQSTGNHLEGSSSFNSHRVLKLDQEKLQRKQDIFSKLKTLDAFTKPLDISECNSEKNENEQDATPLTGRTVVCTCNSNATNVTESSNAKETLVVDESDTILNVTTSKNKLFQEKSENKVLETELDANAIDRHENSFVFNIEKEETESDDVKSNNCKKIISSTKRNQLSKSSITNFSTDTSESYFDVSNHDFAVSSIILTSQNSNFVSNHKEDRAQSDTSSFYVDASDRCSKISSNSTSNLSELRMVNVNVNVNASANETEEIEIKTTDKEIQITDVKAENNLDTKHESLTRTELIPKCTSSLPSNDKRSELNGEGKAVMEDELCLKSSSSLNQDSSKYWPGLNLEKSYSKGRAKSRSCIPVLKSRIDTPRRENSMEAKARSRSPVRRSNTPTMKGTESNSQMRMASSSNESEKKMRQSIYGSKNLLNKKQSYILPSKNSDLKDKVRNTKPESMENKESKITGSVSSELTATPDKSSLLGTPGQLTKECTVIYINIISDSERNETQAVETKEIMKYVNETNLIPQEKKLDPKGESLSLRNIKSDRSSDRKCGLNVGSLTSDSKLCKNLSNDLNSGTENAATVITAEKVKESAKRNELEKISSPSESVKTKANKLLSTSTLEFSNTAKVERREIEVSVKPSVKNTSTSVPDFPDASPEKKLSIYNLENEVFDVSKDFVQKEKIILSEMLTTDPNFFECRKTHRFYNKLGLGFQEQTEQL